MSLEEKKAELKELQSIDYPSDQEDQRMTELKEEIAIIEQEEPKQDPKPINITPRKRSLIEFAIDKIQEKRGKPVIQRENKPTVLGKIIGRFKEKPATWDEIQQLKLDAYRAKLKKSIAVDKAVQREMKMKRINSIIGMVTAKESNHKRGKRRDNNEQEAREFRDMTGYDSKNKYKGLV